MPQAVRHLELVHLVAFSCVPRRRLGLLRQQLQLQHLNTDLHRSDFSKEKNPTNLAVLRWPVGKLDEVAVVASGTRAAPPAEELLASVDVEAVAGTARLGRHEEGLARRGPGRLHHLVLPLMLPPLHLDLQPLVAQLLLRVCTFQPATEKELIVITIIIIIDIILHGINIVLTFVVPSFPSRLSSWLPPSHSPPASPACHGASPLWSASCSCPSPSPSWPRAVPETRPVAAGPARRRRAGGRLRWRSPRFGRPASAATGRWRCNSRPGGRTGSSAAPSRHTPGRPPPPSWPSSAWT